MPARRSNSSRASARGLLPCALAFSRLFLVVYARPALAQLLRLREAVSDRALHDGGLGDDGSAWEVFSVNIDDDGATTE